MILLALQAALLLPPVVPDLLVHRVAVVGDNQLNAFDTFGTICQRLAGERIDLFVGLGDHVQDHGTPGEWQRLFLGPLAPIAHLPRLGAIGNHDDVQGYTQHFWPIPQHPLTSPWGNAVGCWAAVTVGPVRWVFIDTNEAPAITISLQAGGAQRAWLDAEVAGGAWRDARWRVVAFHHPAVTELWDGGCLYPLQETRRWVMERVCLAGGDLVLNGHAHAFQRGAWRGMPFVISGGGGGWLDTTHCFDHPEITVAQARWHYLVIETTSDTLTVQAKTPQGQVFDTLAIR